MIMNQHSIKSLFRHSHFLSEDLCQTTLHCGVDCIAADGDGNDADKSGDVAWFFMGSRKYATNHQ